MHLMVMSVESMSVTNSRKSASRRQLRARTRSRVRGSSQHAASPGAVGVEKATAFGPLPTPSEPVRVVRSFRSACFELASLDNQIHRSRLRWAGPRAGCRGCCGSSLRWLPSRRRRRSPSSRSAAGTDRPGSADCRRRCCSIIRPTMERLPSRSGGPRRASPAAGTQGSSRVGGSSR